MHALGNVVAAKLLLPKPANEDAGGDAGGGGGGKGTGTGKGGGEDSVPLSQDREVIARLIADTNAHLPPGASAECQPPPPPPPPAARPERRPPQPLADGLCEWRENTH